MPVGIKICNILEGINNKCPHTIYSRTSMARTPLGPGKLVRERGSSRQRGLIIAPDQEAL